MGRVVIRRITKKGVSDKRRSAPSVTTTKTDKGLQVDVQTNDEVLRELALQRVQREAEIKQATELAGARRASAEKSAELQNRALDIQVEQRQANVQREQARLNRETRLKRSKVLSDAAQNNVTATSAFKASQIALKSGLAREQGNLQADEARNALLDQIKREEITANKEARIAENPDPVNIFLGETSGNNTITSNSGFTGTGSKITVKTSLTRAQGYVNEGYAAAREALYNPK